MYKRVWRHFVVVVVVIVIVVIVIVADGEGRDDDDGGDGGCNKEVVMVGVVVTAVVELIVAEAVVKWQLNPQSSSLHHYLCGIPLQLIYGCCFRIPWWLKRYALWCHTHVPESSLRHSQHWLVAQPRTRPWNRSPKPQSHRQTHTARPTIDWLIDWVSDWESDWLIDCHIITFKK